MVRLMPYLERTLIRVGRLPFRIAHSKRSFVLRRVMAAAEFEGNLMALEQGNRRSIPSEMIVLPGGTAIMKSTFILTPK